MSKSSKFNSNKTLTVLIVANIVFDIAAIGIWAALPSNTWNGMYRLNSLIASFEAAIAAVFFALTLLGLRRMKKWAPTLAIALTITQRAFAVYVFYPSYAISIPIVWSIVIIYFAFKETRNNKYSTLNSKR